MDCSEGRRIKFTEQARVAMAIQGAAKPIKKSKKLHSGKKLEHKTPLMVVKSLRVM
jgi:hypothetical protein